jgi:hypothetical protein
MRRFAMTTSSQRSEAQRERLREDAWLAMVDYRRRVTTAAVFLFRHGSRSPRQIFDEAGNRTLRDQRAAADLHNADFAVRDQHVKGASADAEDFKCVVDRSEM